MRPEHVLRSEAGGRREAEERAHSPSPSFPDSYDFEGDDDDDDSEEETRGRESDRGSATERSGQDPTPVSAGSAAQQPKPKRTRQLTTPHQSAVLHALLAQSRFPTTQMREEVGRQIGLSARKVQVWFQNQRQKARKESREAATAAAGGSTAVRDIPPQFGPFTNVPPGTSSVSSTAFGEGPSTSRTRTRQGRIGEPSIAITRERAPGSSFTSFDPTSGTHTHTSDPPRRSSDPSFDIYSASNIAVLRRSSGGNLTGPGVPGSSVPVDPLSQRRDSTLAPVSSARYSRPLSPEQPPRLPSVHSLNPSLLPSGRREAQTLSSSPVYQPGRFEQESSHQSLRLPPIQLRPTDQHHEVFVSSHTYSTPAGHTPSTSIPPSRPPFALPSPSSRRGIPLLSSVTPPPIPPPFVLEPNPQWQPPMFVSSRARTQSGPMSHYSTPSAGSSRQLPGANETLLESRTLPPPTRTARFDPVRNTEITPIQPSGRTHSRSPDEED
ncbi:hypothetical protein ACEPAF_1754 [Sanghuangporus sanghuang]